jgi:hypothetical protein
MAARMQYLTSTLARYPNVKPVGTEAFGGRIKILSKTVQDNRDLAKIQASAETLGKRLTQ